ncbi:conserved protein of unknown function [Candidatus Promineifilum breve]|uniref:Nucleotidyltransferase n=1 Tax=Candidatus Promineifilum breve TaxID=1806508 RepID=A0A160T839_9CHLR|nr:nucleotidyltransferase domain-containing protein [Candidatus Promineifilum breve]CUS05548.1 conserved protein of unknown function [Candidatus Promineifilum breve]
MIPTTIRAKIIDRLRAAEATHGVRVLLAVESGSRAWGFASADSDFDVRFIYARPQEWYLSVGLEEQRDVIEQAIVDDIDLSGWDVRKALRLFWKSNPPFAEWLQSPIVYVESGDFAAQCRALLPRVYSSAAGFHHYRNTARTNAAGSLVDGHVSLKKSFYALRALLAIRWLEQYDSAPPMEFGGLLPLIGDNAPLSAAIEALLERKRRTNESDQEPLDETVAAFIRSELRRVDGLTPATAPREDVLPLLDGVFRAVLRET